jgi:hypothetical protein
MSSLPLECQERKGGQDRWHRTSARQREQMQVVSCSRSWVRLGLPQLLLGVCTPRNGGRSALIRDSLWEDLRHAVL